MEQLAKKKELIEWLLDLDDDIILNKISKLKDESVFDFETEFQQGLSMEEFRTAIKHRIKSYASKE